MNIKNCRNCEATVWNTRKGWVHDTTGRRGCRDLDSVAQPEGIRLSWFRRTLDRIEAHRLSA